MKNRIDQPLRATGDNTVFLTVTAYSDYELQAMTLRQSAADHGIPIVLCDAGESWHSFYHHKIERMGEHLKRAHDDGKHFAFILDCRDVVFIDTLDTVLEKFNAMNDGRVIFNHDMPGAIWPSLNDDLLRAMEEAMGSEHARLNAGMIAGNIETMLQIRHHAMEIRRELKEGSPRHGISKRLYQEIGAGFLDDDQHLYQLCLTYYPELFHIDYNKELFALLMSYPKEVREYSDDPKRHDVINHAAIVHSPWLSRESEWIEWALQNKWRESFVLPLSQ